MVGSYGYAAKQNAFTILKHAAAPRSAPRLAPRVIKCVLGCLLQRMWVMQ